VAAPCPVKGCTSNKIWDIKAAQLKAEMAPLKDKGKELAAEPTEKDLYL
jgi:hypothetical protein